MSTDVGQYELLDFGAGRKLERFGCSVIDRPCPTAEQHERAAPRAWTAAHGRFRRTVRTGEGQWSLAEDFPDFWTVTLGRLRLELRPAAAGQIGVFPEQVENWAWIRQQLTGGAAGPTVLNLFGYTGGASLSAAAAGAAVVHVDSSKPAVDWARRNAGHSRLASAPIRWIVEDAAKFVEREMRRGNKYQAIILDPPSYGHGPKGQMWKFDRDIAELLRGCAQLIDQSPRLMLLSCHTPGWSPGRLRELLIDCFPACRASGFSARALQLHSRDGRSLPSGVAVRWQP
jgi:23S rRNA (cytosine1962-C5)-methyltransferase